MLKLAQGCSIVGRLAESLNRWNSLPLFHVAALGDSQYAPPDLCNSIMKDAGGGDENG